MISFDICQQKKLMVKYTKMSSPMPFIVIGGLLCLSSSVGAALMMGGGEEDGGAGANNNQDNTPPVTYVEADTVKLTRSNGPLMIAEVMIYDSDGKLISHATGVTVTSSATHPNWGGVERLTDKVADVPFHSLNSDQNTFAQFKFDTVKKIKRIQVVPRIDSRGPEIGDVSIEVLNGTTSVATGDIPEWNTNSSYVIEFAPKTGTFNTTDVNLEAVKTLITTL
jgi:hypothetical protein